MKSKVKISLAVILVVILGIPPLLAEGEANPPQGGKAPAGQVQKPSQKIVKTYYIWSYDGKLLAEYDQDNNCTREYIYAGNQLVAEYHPMTDKYYYHMTDQVNSTRIVTDDHGNVVYAAAYNPYGGMQKVWVNTLDPRAKFSGKEREPSTDYDYFGARYYNPHQRRFLSPDPVINRKEAIANPQLWNLYAYCRNNPINYLDPDGRISESMGKYEYTVAEHLEIASHDPVTRFFATNILSGYIATGAISAVGKILKWGFKTYKTYKALRALEKSTNFGAKILKQMGKRGWDKKSILKLIRNPDKIVPTKDVRWLNTVRRLDDPATAFIDKSGNYVVRNDVTGDIVQISNRLDPNWKSPFK